MISEDFTKSLLAMTVWQYNQHGLDVMLGVAHALRNRAVAPGWSAVLQSEMKLTHWPHANDPLFTRLLQALDGIYAGRVPDPTNGGKFFAILHQEPEPWFKETILSDKQAHPLVGIIGGFHFFR
jgi:hypothetical protein